MRLISSPSSWNILHSSLSPAAAAAAYFYSAGLLSSVPLLRRLPLALLKKLTTTAGQQNKKISLVFVLISHFFHSTMEASSDCEGDNASLLEAAWNTSMMSLLVSEPELPSSSPEADNSFGNYKHFSADESLQHGNELSELFSVANQSFDVDALTSLCNDINNMDIADIDELADENGDFIETVESTNVESGADMKIRLAYAESAHEDLKDAHHRLECAFNKQASELKKHQSLESDLQRSTIALERVTEERDTAIGHKFMLQQEIKVHCCCCVYQPSTEYSALCALLVYTF